MSIYLLLKTLTKLENLWQDSRINNSDMNYISNPHPSQSPNFARKGLSNLLQLKNPSNIEASQHLKMILKRSRRCSPIISVDPEIQNSFSSKANDSVSFSDDDISDPSTDSETMSCFKGSLSPMRSLAEHNTYKSDLSVTKIKGLRKRQSVTIKLNENIQCVIHLNGREEQQMRKLKENYSLAKEEMEKLRVLVLRAKQGNGVDLRRRKRKF